MKTTAQFVAGGGWLNRERMVRPRAQFFAFLSLYWLLICGCAVIPFWDGWPTTFGIREGLFGGAVLLELVFVVLTVAFLMRKEKPGSVIERQENPGHDFRKLY